VAPERTADLDAALERLLRSQIIVRTSRESGEVYAFKHALIQDIAYESLLRRRRQTLLLVVARLDLSSFLVILKTLDPRGGAECRAQPP
jgi:predicted ATPase